MTFKNFLSAFGLAAVASNTAAAATVASTDTIQYRADEGDQVRVNIPLYGNDRAVIIRVSAADPENTDMRFDASVQSGDSGTARADINSTRAGTLRFAVPQNFLESPAGLSVDVTLANGSGDFQVHTEHHRVATGAVGANLDGVKSILAKGHVPSGDLSGQELHNLVFSTGVQEAYGSPTRVVIGADLDAAKLQNCSWVGGKLTGHAAGITIIGGDYSKTSFAGCGLNDALLLDTTLVDADLHDARLNGGGASRRQLHRRQPTPRPAQRRQSVRRELHGRRPERGRAEQRGSARRRLQQREPSACRSPRRRSAECRPVPAAPRAARRSCLANGPHRRSATTGPRSSRDERRARGVLTRRPAAQNLHIIEVLRGRVC